jgi:predicted transcriptional regulator of viral defense system
MKWHSTERARKSLFDIAKTQAGYFTSRQAEQAGYSRRVQHYHAHRGHWYRIDRGIYRLVEYPSSPHEDLIRWFLWSRAKAVVSHETAAAVYEIGDVMPARIHLTVPTSFRKKVPACLIVHRADLPAEDVTRWNDVAITTPLRTVMDLSGSWIETDALAAVVRDALRDGAVSRDEIEAGLSGLDEPHRERLQRILSTVEGRQHAV